MSTDSKQNIGPTDAELESFTEPLGELSEVGEAVEPVVEKSVPAEPAAAKNSKDEEEPEQEKPRGSALGGFLKRNFDVYTVMLGIGVIAIAIGIVCLLVELWRYNFDVKAKDYRAGHSLRAYDSLASLQPDPLPGADQQSPT